MAAVFSQRGAGLGIEGRQAGGCGGGPSKAVLPGRESGTWEEERQGDMKASFLPGNLTEAVPPNYSLQGQLRGIGSSDTPLFVNTNVMW